MKTPATAPVSIPEALEAVVAKHCLPGLVTVVGGPRTVPTAKGPVRQYVVSIRYAAIPGKWDCCVTTCRWPLKSEGTPAAARGMAKRLLGSLKSDYLKPLVVGA